MNDITKIAQRYTLVCESNQQTIYKIVCVDEETRGQYPVENIATFEASSDIETALAQYTIDVTEDEDTGYEIRAGIGKEGAYVGDMQTGQVALILAPYHPLYDMLDGMIAADLEAAIEQVVNDSTDLNVDEIILKYKKHKALELTHPDTQDTFGDLLS